MTTAIEDFLKNCTGQDYVRRDDEEYLLPKDLVRRVLHVLINFDDEEGEFMCEQLRHSIKLSGTADVVALEPAFTQHLREFLKEQS